MRYILFFLFISIASFAQTGIGTTTPNASAKLDVYSTNKGFLPPRVTLTGVSDASTIASPAEGLLVYNLGSSGLQAGYYYWNGANWATIATATSAGNGVTASDMVKIYDGVGNAATINANGATFSVTTSGRYSFDFATSATCGNCTVTLNFQVRDGSNNNAIIGSDMQTSYNNNVHAEYNGKVEANLISGRSYNVLVTASSGGIYNNDYTRVYLKQVAGNLPVTGQSVDFLQASLSANQTISAVGNVLFNTSSGAGITITNGGFDLKANKTYKLEAAVGGYSTGYGYYAWVDNTNTILAGGSVGVVMKAGNAYSDAPQDKAVVFYTPTVNTTVYLRVYNLSGTVIAYAPSLLTNYSSTWATIQQVGSSAFVNPWVLSGNDVYNITGKVGIGTNAPASTLDVTGSLTVSGATNLKNTLNVGTGVGFEGGEIDLVTAASGNTSLTNGTVALDVYGDKLRIFENGGNARGVFVDLSKAPNAVGGELLWKINSTIQSSFNINATITAPTLGTRSINQISYRLNGDKYRLTYRLGATGGTSHGSGDYLFNLPTGLTFNTASGYNPVYTGGIWSPNIASMAPYFIPAAGGLVMSGVWTMQMQIVPYNSTQFRVAVAASSTGYSFWSSSYFAIAQDMLWDAEFEIWAQ